MIFLPKLQLGRWGVRRLRFRRGWPSETAGDTTVSVPHAKHGTQGLPGSSADRLVKPDFGTCLEVSSACHTHVGTPEMSDRGHGRIGPKHQYLQNIIGLD